MSYVLMGELCYFLASLDLYSLKSKRLDEELRFIPALTPNFYSNIRLMVFDRFSFIDAFFIVIELLRFETDMKESSLIRAISLIVFYMKICLARLAVFVY